MSGYGRRKVLAMQYAGDPGLFGFLGKAIGGVAKIAGNLLPGPIGAVAKLAGNVLSPGQKAVAGPTSSMGLTQSVTPIFGPMPGVPQLPQVGSQVGLVNIVRPGAGPQLLGPGNNTQSGPGSQVGWTPREQAACQAGYHKNKHDYWTKKYGFIPKHSVCVKNRRRNPLNPRAASRSMSRLKSAQKAARFLGKFSFGGHRGNGRPGPAAKAGCGCKGKR